ncbi:LytR/AlgR family response regulator transcription factor [Calidifontibacter terrae]
MRPLTVLVVDDEPPARSELAFLLGRDDHIGEVHQAASGGEALDLLHQRDIDVVFSDINMPGLDGLQLARVIARFERRPQLVFVTAYDDYAVDAFEVDVVDYVMKPVRPERLAQAVRRCLGPASEPATAVEDERIAVDIAGVTTFVQRSDVRFVQAQGDYAQLHTATSTHLLRIPLATLEERWAAAGFVRIHRSTLVNTGYVEAVHTDDGRCSVRIGAVTLPVSRRHTRDLRARLLRRDAK